MLNKIEGFAKKHQMFPQEGVILAAVSGGADSVCLLAALLELRGKYGFGVAAAHFNHRLRGNESDRDEQFVVQLCRDNNTVLYTGSADVGGYARENHLGVEEAARRLRYDFFYETAKNNRVVRIATAHTADDNAETVLFNLTRGTGLKGLGGIPPVRGNIIRPMLTVSRSEVLSYLSERSLTFVEDSTNLSEEYSRNLIRRRVIPVLRTLNPRLTQNIGSASSRIREDEEYLSGIAEQFVKHNARRDANGETSLDAKGLNTLPRPISTRAVRLLSGVSLSSEHVKAVLDLSRSDSVSGEIQLPSVTVFREYDRIVFSRESSLSGFNSVSLAEGGTATLPELGLCVSCKKTICSKKINNSFTSFLFKFDSICGNIVIRPRETGDKIELFGRNGTKTLKKLFIEKRIPVRKRPLVPVIADLKGVLGVYRLGFDKRTACKAGDLALKIVFEETSYEKGYRKSILY